MTELYHDTNLGTMWITHVHHHEIAILDMIALELWYGYRDHFPKKSRYTLGDKIDSRFLNVLELISIATYQNPTEKLPTLDRAIMGIDVLKFLLRVAWELHILDDKKYTALSEGVQETKEKRDRTKF